MLVFQENSECSGSPISGLGTWFASNHCSLAVCFTEDKSFAEGLSRKCRRVSLCRERVLVFSALTALPSNWYQVSSQASPGFRSVLSQDLHEVACQVLTSQVHDGMKENIGLTDWHSVGDHAPRIHHDATGSTRDMQGQHSLDGYEYDWGVEALKHELGHLLQLAMGTGRASVSSMGCSSRESTHNLL